MLQKPWWGQVTGSIWNCPDCCQLHVLMCCFGGICRKSSITPGYNCSRKRNTALRTLGFYRSASRITGCHCLERSQPWARPDSVGKLPESQDVNLPERRSPERAWILSEGFPKSKMPFFKKNTILSSLGFYRHICKTYIVPRSNQIITKLENLEIQDRTPNYRIFCLPQYFKTMRESQQHQRVCTASLMKPPLLAAGLMSLCHWSKHVRM